MAPMMNRRQSYSDIVLATSPIAYWPLDETSGTAAVNYGSISSGNGAYVNALPGQIAGPFGGLAPYFDGAGDAVNVYSAALNTAFNGALGSMAIWGKVYSADEWSDSTLRALIHLYATINNRVYIEKTTAANTVEWRFVGGATVDNEVQIISSTGWQHYGITWNLAQDRVIHYLNGTATETDSGIGTWAGALDASKCAIGSTSNGGADSWKGYLAHGAVWAKELSPTEMAALAAG